MDKFCNYMKIYLYYFHAIFYVFIVTHIPNFIVLAIIYPFKVAIFLEFFITFFNFTFKIKMR